MDTKEEENGEGVKGEAGERSEGEEMPSGRWGLMGRNMGTKEEVEGI